VDTKLRLTGRQHERLKAHLLPGDGNEAVALALCGRHAGRGHHMLSVRSITLVPYEHCRVREPGRITWSTERLRPLLQEAARDGLTLLKVHSHPGGFEHFSLWDDAADRDLFPSVYGWAGDAGPHASTVMLPDGRVFGRTVDDRGRFEPLTLVSVAGADIRMWPVCGCEAGPPEFARRHAQALGSGTTALLRRLSVAVVGCSGTGSPVVEQLARLGVGRLVLVDPDHVEVKNLNRVYNATMADAVGRRPKVEVMARAVAAMELGTEVTPLAKDLFDHGVVGAVAEADVIFGCLDSVDGRHLLNRLAAFYSVPYFDLGVRLDADGRGGLDQVCGTVHYLQPDGSSLLSRGVYTLEQVRAAGLRRTDPEAYAQERRSKYIQGVHEERPAVISVNTMVAAMAVNEFLARLHPFRVDGNDAFAAHGVSLTQAQSYAVPEGEPYRVLARHAGRGDVRPLLDMPALSEAVAVS
jgi:hypothetical protein